MLALRLHSKSCTSSRTIRLGANNNVRRTASVQQFESVGRMVKRVTFVELSRWNGISRILTSIDVAAIREHDGGVRVVWRSPKKCSGPSSQCLSSSARSEQSTTEITHVGMASMETAIAAVTRKVSCIANVCLNFDEDTGSFQRLRDSTCGSEYQAVAEAPT